MQALRRSASTGDNDQWMKYKEVQEKIHAYSMYHAIDLPETNEGKDDALLRYVVPAQSGEAENRMILKPFGAG